MQRRTPATPKVAQATGRLPGATSTGTSTGAAAGAGTAPRTPGGSTPMLAGVPAVVRMQMELVACASATPEDALAPVIELLVDGSPQKRAAIVAAISTNDPLREQWERTWEVLRG